MAYRVTHYSNDSDALTLNPALAGFFVARRRCVLGGFLGVRM